MPLDTYQQTSIIHVEAILKPDSNVPPDSLEQPIQHYLSRHFANGLFLPFKIENSRLADADVFISQNILRLSANDDEDENGSKTLSLASVRFVVHLYQMHECGSVEEELSQPSANGGLFSSNDGLADSITAALHWTLPCTDFDGLWESLFYDEPIKQKLLRYAQTALVFADAKVDPTVITMNRVVLLHGPPGTGKTSLCKALAQKLAIRLSRRFRCGQLIEINSHSLFSKYFSESGKLVLQMFKKISEFLDDPDVFVCILIDEVESLTAARRGAMQGNEPSDALRVVNALLTQIDQLKKRSNVLLMTTSNLTDAIDAAFIDRADIKLCVQLPSVKATYHVLQSTIEELIRVNLLEGTLSSVDPMSVSDYRLQSLPQYRGTNLLFSISKRAVDGGVSCRTLRKLAFLAYSEVCRRRNIIDSVGSSTKIAIEDFLPFLGMALDSAIKEAKALTGNDANKKPSSNDETDKDEKKSIKGKENLSRLTDDLEVDFMAI